MPTVKALDPKRITPETLSSIQQWIEFFLEYLNNYCLSFKWIVNANESRINFGGNKLPYTRLESNLKIVKGASTPHFMKGATYVPFVSSQGQIIMDVFVIPSLIMFHDVLIN